MKNIPEKAEIHRSPSGILFSQYSFIRRSVKLEEFFAAFGKKCR